MWRIGRFKAALAKGAYDEALNHAREAQRLVVEIPVSDLVPGDAMVRNLATQALGHALLRVGDYRGALPHYIEAEGRYQGAAERRPSMRRTYLEHLAAVLNEQASIHGNLGNWSEARRCHEAKAEVLAEVDPDRGLLAAQTNQALFLNATGDAYGAHALLETVVQKMRTRLAALSGAADTEARRDLGSVIHNLALVQHELYLVEKHREHAGPVSQSELHPRLTACQELVEEALALTPAEDPLSAAASLALLARVLLEQQRPDEARAHCETALATPHLAPQTLGELHQLVGFAHRAGQQYEQAFAAFRASDCAFAALLREGYHPARSRVLFEIAAACWQSGDQDGTRTHLIEAIRYEDAGIGDLLVHGGQRSRADLVDRLVRPNLDLILALGRRVLAESAASRATLLAACVQRLDLELRFWLALQRTASSCDSADLCLAAWRQRLRDLGAALLVEPEPAAELEALERAEEELLVSLRSESQVGLDHLVLTPDRLLQRFQGSDRAAALLVLTGYYDMFDQERRYLGWFVTPGEDGPNLALIDLGAARPIETDIDTWRQVIKLEGGTDTGRAPTADSRPDGRGLTASERSVGERLRVAIWDPCARGWAAPSGSNRPPLVEVLCDSALTRVPFATLPLPGAGFLLDRYDFCYLTDLDSRPDSRLCLGRPALALACSRFPAGQADAPDQSLRSRLQQCHWPPLPSAATEAETVAELFPQTEILKRGNATLQHLVTASMRSPDLGLVHLVTHGFLLPEDRLVGTDAETAAYLPAQVQLGKRRPPRVSDTMRKLSLCGMLLGVEGGGCDYVNGVSMLGLPWSGVALLALSLCNSATSETSTGRGLRGLQFAGRIAGAQAVLASLGPIGSLATEELMSRFYELATDPNEPLAPIHALHAAQRELREDPQLPIRDWGAFILQG